jgi:hypothetical protein
MRYKIGCVVKDKYDCVGVVTKVYANWEDLKSKNKFLTLDDNNLDQIEKLIKGDVKDKWLELQEIPYTLKQLEETWYSISCLFGGSIWASESTLTSTNTLN